MNRIPESIVQCVLELTYSCNFKCLHCFIDDNYMPKIFFNYQKSKETLLRLLEELEIQEVYLFGGEPLLHRDFFNIYEDLHDLGFQVSLATNGSLITDKHIEMFCKKPPLLLWISLYGYSVRSYLDFTKANFFEKVRTNIISLKKSSINFGIKYLANRYTFPSTITKTEIANIFNLDLEYFFFKSRIFPTIAGSVENQYLAFTEKERLERNLIAEGCSNCNYSSCKPYNEKIVISPIGSVRSCIPQADTFQTNIYDHSSLEILNILEKEHQKQYIYPFKCNTCDSKNICGCPILLKRYGDNLNFACKK